MGRLTRWHMHWRKTGPAVIWGVLITLLLSSCHHPYHQPNERYMLVTVNIHQPYWVEAIAGFKHAASVLGVHAQVVGPDDYNPGQEVADFQKAAASNPTGILLAPAQAESFNAPVTAAIQNGIPVLTMDSDAPASRRLLFIGTDNVKAGAEGAGHIAALLHGAGNVVIIAIAGQLNQQQRLQGAKQVLGAYPKIKVIATLNDDGRSGKANDEISELLAEKKKVNGILSLDASGGPGAAEVLHRLDMKGRIQIVAFDKNPETLDWISEGLIEGSVAQKPYTMGYFGLIFLDDLHHNAVHLFRNWRSAPASPLPERVDTGTAWVDSSNIAAFKAAIPSYQQPMNSF
ncbi:MAG: substrate-binding domain-containing protein, partial [Terriglobia bacterium]